MQSKMSRSSKKERSLARPAKLSQKDTPALKRNIPLAEDSTEFQSTRKIRRLNNQTDLEKTVSPQYPRSRFEKQDVLPVEQERKSQDPQKKERQISKIPLKAKFCHLVPEHISAQYTLQQKELLNIQISLDEHLDFLKSVRGRKRGAFFKQIRANLIQTKNQFIELAHIKQILFLLPHFYTFQRGLDQDHCYDILLDLPQQANLTTRKDQFKKGMFQFIKTKACLGENVSMPMFQFPFEERIETQKKLKLQSPQQVKSTKALVEVKKDNLMDSLFKNRNQFKQKLYKGLKEKQQKLRQEQQKLKVESLVFARSDLLSLIDSIQQIYMSGSISNMCYTTLVIKLDQRLAFSKQSLIKMIEMSLELIPDYLQLVEHRIGRIIQCDKQKYREARAHILDLTF